MENKNDILIKIGIIILTILIWSFIGYAIWKGATYQLPQENSLETILSDKYVIIQGNSLKAVVDPVYLGEPYQVLGVITAYNNLPEQTWGDPNIMASGKRVYEGAIANNCLPFKTIVEINGSFYIVEDRMNERYNCRYFDIFMWSYKDAINWGRKTKEVIIYH